MEKVSENKETYLSSSQKKIPRITIGGSGICCCVPHYGRTSYYKHKQKSGIGFFKFPENVALFKVLKKTIGQCRREGGSGTLKTRKQRVFVNFSSRQKRSKFPMV